jgi:hypothetical protein
MGLYKWPYLVDAHAVLQDNLNISLHDAAYSSHSIEGDKNDHNTVCGILVVFFIVIILFCLFCMFIMYSRSYYDCGKCFDTRNVCMYVCMSVANFIKHTLF